MIWVIEQWGVWLEGKRQTWDWYPQSFYTTRKAAREKAKRYIDKLNLDGKVRVRKYERTKS